MINKTIGIVGGVGSYAGIDLIKKVYDLTEAKSDQEHLPVSMLSVPHKIIDRTKYLLGETTVNPGIAISEIIATLIASGSNIIAIPCNTAHAKPIFNLIEKSIPESCVLVNLIEEVGLYIATKHPEIKKVGVLGTTGTILAKVYPDVLAKYNIEVIQPSEDIQNLFVHPSIYDANYGIKAFSNPVNKKAKENLNMAATYLSRKGAQAVILGCTEIPLAIQDTKIEDSLIIDATTVLAGALIRESRKTKEQNS
ncbi:aspartate/glutamate racemase family protein [Cellulophaga omnivescoria]|uniref:aspartate/glutamate racemase family protein n=1 Tax=Cellulophaga omnivescoria TaxID=1888890 RepID=UPI0009851815|nr:amino acid racemase [Cellulophaga omnivescoria]WBU89784.1 amino acid racemase [Cellulophaga omnivescoria]WKB81906.1 amino acid racemase [Cellulophaga lytica]